MCVCVYKYILRTFSPPNSLAVVLGEGLSARWSEAQALCVCEFGLYTRFSLCSGQPLTHRTLKGALQLLSKRSG